MIADIFQLPVTAIETAQGPAYGAAILACAGESGRKLESICAAWIRTSETFQPNRELRQYYDDKYKNYKLLYPALHSVFHRGQFHLHIVLARRPSERGIDALLTCFADSAGSF